MSGKILFPLIAGLAASSSALAQDYYNQGSFQSAASGAGNGQLFVEDFEETTPGYFAACTASPLSMGVPNGPYPGGLNYNLTLQSNLMGDGGATLQPRGGGCDLAAWEGGNGFPATDAVVANYFVDGLDTIVNDPNVYAVGFNPMCYSGSGQVQIQIYDTANSLLGVFKSPASNSEKDFFGYVSNVPIGRVNVWDTAGGLAEGADNFEVWTAVPAPGAAALLGLGGLVAGRRRRA